MALPGIDGITDSDGLCGGCYTPDCDGTNCPRISNIPKHTEPTPQITFSYESDYDELPF